MSKSSYPSPYRMTPTPGNPRQMEAWALTEAARRMKEAQTEPLDPAAFLHAVRLNWRLWTIFQAEMSSPDCPMPAEIRTNMIALCNFVDKTTVDIISQPIATKVNVLININREIASGLLATPPGESATLDAAPPANDLRQPMPQPARVAAGGGAPRPASGSFDEST